jgi:hypothetical protein
MTVADLIHQPPLNLFPVDTLVMVEGDMRCAHLRVSPLAQSSRNAFFLGGENSPATPHLLK